MGCLEAVQLVFKDAIGELVRPFFDRYNVLKGTVGWVIPQLSQPFMSTDHTRLALQACHHGAREHVRRTNDRAHTVHPVARDFAVHAERPLPVRWTRDVTGDIQGYSGRQDWRGGR